MSKFNTSNAGVNTTTNKSGYTAYKMEDKAKLVTQVLTSFFNENKYYGDTSNDLIKTAKIVIANDPLFVANLARYARKEMHLRSVAHALTALIAHEVNSKSYIKVVVDDVVERADDITEILACYISMYGKPIPNGLKKALAGAIKKFNEFQISKYNGGAKSVKFKDVLKITHAKPDSEEQSALFKKILEDNLETAERWETELSTKGNTKEVWEGLIEGNKVGYMAMLRNLRNILNAQPANIDKVFNKLSNEREVERCKQLPFRFYSAYREVYENKNVGSRVFDVLETAIEYSIKNLPKLKGTTVIAIDTSGSMGNAISSKSKVRCVEIASLLGVMASKMCENAIVYEFNTKLKKLNISTRGGIIERTMAMSFDGGGTNINLPLQEMIKNHIVADRLIVLSDNEINNGWNSTRGWWDNRTCQSYADEYRRTVNKDLWVHAIDLQGYGTQQFVGAKTNILAGWNEKVFDFIDIAEKGIDNQVKYIEEYDKRQG